MIPSLKRRAAEPELMDDLTAGGPDLSEALRHLRRLNRIFAASGPTLYGVRQILVGSGTAGAILDIGHRCRLGGCQPAASALGGP